MDELEALRKLKDDIALQVGYLSNKSCPQCHERYGSDDDEGNVIYCECCDDVVHCLLGMEGALWDAIEGWNVAERLKSVV